MRWRIATEEDYTEILALTREPMQGNISISWGMKYLSAPPECRDLIVGVVEHQSQIVATGMSWRWPDGQRYLAGLRISSTCPIHPPKDVWISAYRTVLPDEEVAWTTIGKENTVARRLLEKKLSGFPDYQPCQQIRTWYLPVKKNKKVPAVHPGKLASHRKVSVFSGAGPAYRLGRLSHFLGYPGIPAPGQPIQLAYLQPNPDADPLEDIQRIRHEMATTSAVDGWILVLPTDSEWFKIWSSVSPRISFTWDSILYAVRWNQQTVVPVVPSWQAKWL